MLVREIFWSQRLSAEDVLLSFANFPFQGNWCPRVYTTSTCTHFRNCRCINGGDAEEEQSHSFFRYVCMCVCVVNKFEYLKFYFSFYSVTQSFLDFLPLVEYLIDVGSQTYFKKLSLWLVCLKLNGCHVITINWKNNFGKNGSFVSQTKRSSNRMPGKQLVKKDLTFLYLIPETFLWLKKFRFSWFVRIGTEKWDNLYCFWGFPKSPSFFSPLFCFSPKRYLNRVVCTCGY